eukprot:3549819-Rhodomonas_salina.1
MVTLLRTIGHVKTFVTDVFININNITVISKTAKSSNVHALEFLAGSVSSVRVSESAENGHIPCDTAKGVLFVDQGVKQFNSVIISALDLGTR